MKHERHFKKNLALFGGSPAFAKKLHVNAPNVLSKELFDRYVETIFESGWLSNSGPLEQELESRLASLLDVKHCILTCNGTSAMSLAISALGLHGEVILPSFNFISTAHTLTQQGIKPIFCDIDVKGNICPEACKKLITPETTAIIATHLWGRPCAIEELEILAKSNNIHLLFDAAHAFNCSFNGQIIGRFGEAEIFSFHATKSFHTFEGGAVTTNNDNLAEMIRKTKNFGFSNYDQVDCIGTNAKMSEVCAAMGLANLENIENSIDISRSNYYMYARELKEVPGVSILKYDDSEKNNYHYIVLEINIRESGLSRDQIVTILHAENVIARRYFYPGNHQMEPYKTLFPEADQLLPETNQLSQKVLLLPGGVMIGHEEITKICQLLKAIITSPDKQNIRQAII